MPFPWCGARIANTPDLRNLGLNCIVHGGTEALRTRTSAHEEGAKMDEVIDHEQQKQG